MVKVSSGLRFSEKRIWEVGSQRHDTQVEEKWDEWRSGDSWARAWAKFHVKMLLHLPCG